LSRRSLPSLKATPRIWLSAVGMGALSNALPFTLLAWSQQYVTSGFAGISVAMVPLFTLVLAHFFLQGERLTARRVVGFALGLTGVVMLIGTDALAYGGDQLEPIARILCIAAAGSYAAGSIVTRRSPPVDPIAFSTLALIAASTMIVPIALWVDGVPSLLPPIHAMAALVYLGLLPTAVATLILVHVIRTAGPTFLTLTNYYVPVWAVIFGLVVLQETLPPQFVFALGLILAGLLVSRASMRRRPAT